jgi:hypothetical protein
MSSDGILRTKAFDKIIEDASQGETIGENYERMKESFHAAMAANPSAAAPSDSSVPAAYQFKYEREVRFHPESGRRTLVLRADSEADLDALERSILYGK